MSTFTLEIHAIQSVPPNNINRDDTGSPKTALYGGVLRSRVSSQAWKRAIRKRFSDLLDARDTGVRTLRAAELLREAILEQDPERSPEAAAEMAKLTLEAAGFKLVEPKAKKSKNADPDNEESETPLPRTQALVFFSRRQYARMAEVAIAADGAKPGAREAKAAADLDHGIEVSLFGRMVAESADLNVDSAVQVAHAISTHAVEPESDYYTAVDDHKSPDEDAGAGMIGTIEYSSSTLYRYACVNLGLLRENLGDSSMTARAAEAFAHGFITSMPTGKQNTFANGTLPDAVLVTIRQGSGVNLVGAFEEAVDVRKGSLVRQSCVAFTKYAQECNTAYAGVPTKSWVLAVGDRAKSLTELGDNLPLPQLLTAIQTSVLDLTQDES